MGKLWVYHDRGLLGQYIVEVVEVLCGHGHWVSAGWSVAYVVGVITFTLETLVADG